MSIHIITLKFTTPHMPQVYKTSNFNIQKIIIKYPFSFHYIYHIRDTGILIHSLSLKYRNEKDIKLPRSQFYPTRKIIYFFSCFCCCCCKSQKQKENYYVGTISKQSERMEIYLQSNSYIK